MNKKLYRSRNKKVVSGVCGGLEDYLGIDVTLIRLVWVILSLASSAFPGLVAYIIAAIIIPEEPAGMDGWQNGNGEWQDGQNDQWQNPGPQADDRKQNQQSSSWQGGWQSSGWQNQAQNNYGQQNGNWQSSQNSSTESSGYKTAEPKSTEGSEEGK